MPSKPKHFESWNQERQQEWMKKKKDWNARSRVKRIAENKAYFLIWYAKNSDKQKARAARYREENRAKEKERYARWYANNSDELKASRRRERAELPLPYIAHCMGVPTSLLKNLRPELIEAKRKVIRTNRVIKQIKQQIDEETHD